MYECASTRAVTVVLNDIQEPLPDQANCCAAMVAVNLEYCRSSMATVMRIRRASVYVRS